MKKKFGDHGVCQKKIFDTFQKTTPVMEKLRKKVRVAVEGHKHLMQQSLFYFIFYTLQKFLQERGNTGHTVVLCSLELEELND